MRPCGRKKKFKEKLMPQKKVKEIVEEKEFELIQVMSIVEKGKMKSINLSDSLFSSLEETKFTLNSTHFKKYGWDIILDKDIEVTNTQESGKIVLTALYKDEQFTEKIESIHLESAIEKLVKKIYEYYVNQKPD